MSLAIEGISKEAHDEACCTYAALLLNDAEVEVSAESMAKVIEASGNEVEGYWPALFAGLLKKVDVAELVANSAKPGSGGNASAGTGAAASGEEKEAEKEDKEEPAEVVEGAGGLFNDDAGDGY